MFSTLISQKKRDLFGSLLAYSYLCKRSLARYSSVNAGVTFVGKKRKHSLLFRVQPKASETSWK